MSATAGQQQPVGSLAAAPNFAEAGAAPVTYEQAQYVTGSMGQGSVTYVTTAQPEYIQTATPQPTTVYAAPQQYYAAPAPQYTTMGQVEGADGQPTVVYQMPAQPNFPSYVAPAAGYYPAMPQAVSYVAAPIQTAPAGEQQAFTTAVMPQYQVQPMQQVYSYQAPLAPSPSMVAYPSYNMAAASQAAAASAIPAPVAAAAAAPPAASKVPEPAAPKKKEEKGSKKGSGSKKQKKKSCC
mmetsp:Transcript_13629/g.20768  ORF Transcript_13629/g.20768 Transcript_13629/m.20768 type:complete len:238 (-) Transcript_13629:122-835(-)